MSEIQRLGWNDWTIDFEVRNCGKNVWAAFGFSNDQKMVFI